MLLKHVVAILISAHLITLSCQTVRWIQVYQSIVYFSVTSHLLWILNESALFVLVCSEQFYLRAGSNTICDSDSLQKCR